MHLTSSLKGALFALCLLPLFSNAVPPVATTPPPVAIDGPALTVTAENPSGIVAPGQKIIWRVAVSGDPTHTVQNATYVVKKGGGASHR